MNNDKEEKKFKIELELFRTYLILIIGLTAGTTSLILLFINEKNDLYHNNIILGLIIVAAIPLCLILFLFMKSFYKFFKQLKK